jgi:hypothetical protein
MVEEPATEGDISNPSVAEESATQSVLSVLESLFALF